MAFILKEKNLLTSVQDMDHHTTRFKDVVMAGFGTIAQSPGFESTHANGPIKFNTANTNFAKIAEIPSSYEGIHVSLYKSRETGLKVLIANVEVPVVCLKLLRMLTSRCRDTLPSLLKSSTIVDVLMYSFILTRLMYRRLNT